MTHGSTSDIPKTGAKQYCKRQHEDGRVCSLYKDHYGDHKPDHKSTNTDTWSD